MHPRSAHRLARALAAALVGASLAPAAALADAPQGHYMPVHAFTSDEGAYPHGTLLPLPDGGFIGTAFEGGAFGTGTVYVLKPGAGQVEVLHSFEGGPHDGADPFAGLTMDAQGTLWGTTAYGGAHDAGTLFRITDRRVHIVHMFGRDPDGGRKPLVRLTLASDGRLYGTTSEGGSAGSGIVFRLEADGSTTTLWDMADGNLVTLQGRLLQASNGLLYGTSSYGGDRGGGAVFSLAPDGSAHRIVHAFDVQDGFWSMGGVIEGSDHRLYGMTTQGGGGGVEGLGTVFSMNLDGSDFKVLHSFTGGRGDGSVPLGELVETSPGVFVGTTSLGGKEDQGTVFQVDANGDLTLLHTFTYFGGEHRRYVDGRTPDSTLTPVAGHVLLGVTQSGGDADDVGTVFKLRAD